MPYYLGQVAYTYEAIKHMDEYPQNRIEAVRPAYEELGVTIREAFLAFGDYDVVLLLEAPDNVHMEALPGGHSGRSDWPLQDHAVDDVGRGGRGDAACGRI